MTLQCYMSLWLCAFIVLISSFEVDGFYKPTLISKQYSRHLVRIDYKRTEVADAAEVTIKTEQPLITRPTVSELDSLMEKLPANEKYSLLIQSYASKILEDRNSRQPESIGKIEALYYEMVPYLYAFHSTIDYSSRT